MARSAVQYEAQIPRRHEAVGRWLLQAHLFLSPLIFCTFTVDAFEENKVALLDLTAIALTAWGAVAWIGRWHATSQLSPPREKERKQWDLVTVGFVLLAGSALVATVGSISPLTSWRGAVSSDAGLVTVLGYLILYLATRAWCRSSEARRSLLAAAAVAASLAAGYGLIQVVGLDPLHWQDQASYAGRERPFATLAHPNSLGAFLVMAGPFLAFFAREALRSGRRLVGLTWLAALSLCGVVVLATLSRSAWLGAGSVVLFLALLLGRRGGKGWIVAGGILGLAALLAVLAGFQFEFGKGVLERVRHLGAAEGRWYLWQAGWDLFRERPLLGWGLDTYRLAFGLKRPVGYWAVEGSGAPSRAHCEVLNVLATQGLLGGAALGILFLGLLRSGLRAWRRACPDEQPLLAAVLACLVGLAAPNLLGFTISSCGVLFVTCAALVSRWGAADEPLAEQSRWITASWWRWPAQLAVGAIAVALAGVLVVRPFLASVACRAGDGLVQQSPAAAEACYQRAVTLDPWCERYWTRLGGAAQVAAGRATTAAEQAACLRRARRALERAVALVPVDPYPHANLGRLLGDMSRCGGASAAEALAEWDQALSLDPHNALFLAQAARTALDLGDGPRARRLAERGLKDYPRSGHLRALLGSCMGLEGRPAEAVTTLTESLKGSWQDEENEQDRTLGALAAAALGEKQYPLAQWAARLALERQPRWVSPRFVLAQTLDLQGRREEARREYQQVLTLAPGYAPARAALGRLDGDSRYP